MLLNPKTIDRLYHTAIAKRSGDISPAALWLAYLDWLIHLSLSPGKQLELMSRLAEYGLELQNYAACVGNGARASSDQCVAPAPADKRFSSVEWSQWPFNLLHQSFLLWQKLWDDATLNVRGVSSENQQVVHFCARQLLDMMAPANFAVTNPEVLQRTLSENGSNLVRGYLNLLEDVFRYGARAGPVGIEAFKVGKTIAATPGEIIYRNELIELIQYRPTTGTVYPEPVLIVPAWIMKYYILDLSQHNSLVRYLVAQGFTVFMISWKNPDETYRNVGMDQYRRLGVMEALQVISKVVPERKVNALGYCLGGTLLAIAAAAMARHNDERIKTLTLCAAQTDFSEPGELELFMGESQLAFLEDMMEEQGYLDGTQMAATFQLLRSNEQIWSRLFHDYLMGKRRPATDLMAWNADATRMPARMHSEYLRNIFFGNQLTEGRYVVDGRPVVLQDLHIPIFVVGAESDHISPWRSVYQIELHADTDVTFLLTSGGHNAGIVSEPGGRERTYRVRTLKHGDLYVDPDTWFRQTPVKHGSWWPEWVRWLKAGSNEFSSPPRMGAPEAGYPPLCEAPGTYVFG